MSGILQNLGGLKIIYTTVYGFHTQTQRQALWDRIKLIAQNVSSPWIISGDFNAVLYDSNRVGPCNNSRNANEEFFNTIHNVELMEIQGVGNKFI